MASQRPRILIYTMVRIIPSRLKSYTGGTSRSSANNESGTVAPKSTMQKREASPGSPAAKANGLMLRVVVMRVCPPRLWMAEEVE